jgi:VWFA-related protein
MTSRYSLSLTLGLVALLAFVAWAQDDSRNEEPRDVGLVEETGRRLAQLDVTVDGPAGVIETLEKSDFELVVAGRFIEEFVVDNLCSPATSPERAPQATTVASGDDSPESTPEVRRPPATYLFYFDQHHLTPAGRQTGLDTAHELVTKLIRDGNRGLIFSSGKEMRAYCEMTDDPQTLHDALDRLENDRNQWDEWAFAEDFRIREILESIRSRNDIDRAISIARTHQRDEVWRTARALRKLSITIGRLANVDPPKAVIYFADTMRSNAGAHYLSFFGQNRNDAVLTAMETDAFNAGNDFERVIEEAGANGVRLYTVQAEGLVTDTSALGFGSSALARSGTSVRVQDAQNSLVGLAMETGGQSFLNGVPAAKIAKRIDENLSCLYLLSFDPKGLPMDRGLAVLVRVGRPEVRARARGQLVIQSEPKRRASRLLAAFAGTTGQAVHQELHGVVVPTGFEDGAFSALVQLHVPGSALPGVAWELGASLVSRGKVREDASGQVSIHRPGVPVVYETEMRFKPGPYELMIVAHEAGTEQIVTGRLEGEWPDPDDAAASVGPIVTMQPQKGAFLRDEQLKPHGALGRGADRAVRPELATAFIGIVCRGRSAKGGMRVERRLVGETTAEFEPSELDLGEDRCVQIRDLVFERTMTEGTFSYQVRVLRGDEELASGQLDFHAIAGDAAVDPGAALPASSGGDG